MPAGLNAAKTKFRQNIKNALKDAFKATYILGEGDYGDEISEKFAEKGAGPIVDAVEEFIKQAKITGTNSMVSSVVAPGSPTGGPCSGALSFDGTELSIS